MLKEGIYATSAKLFRAVNRRKAWHELPFLAAVANLVTYRATYRRENVFDTERGGTTAAAPNGFDVKSHRTADGSYNDLRRPEMGQSHARFGRNVPIAETFGETEQGLLSPSPREVSRRLLRRNEAAADKGFIPAPTLNVLAAGWLQFMVHDWFGHEKGDRENPIRIPLHPDDQDWPEQGVMRIDRTPRGRGTGPADEGLPATYRNSETHWWDASQLYGSSLERQNEVRAGRSAEGETPPVPRPDGKIALDPHGHLPKDRHGIELSGVNGGWWIGLSAVHTLFAREHNAIVDHLRACFPERGGDGDWLFHQARLINAALIAKIHTVEWTPALLDTRTLRFLMRSSWWGVIGERLCNRFGAVLPRSWDVLRGIPGSRQDHDGTPFSMTEEFAAVYRMHPLLPDEFSLRRAADDAPIGEDQPRSLPEVAGDKVALLYDEAGKAHALADMLYSLGTRHPGAPVLHNFPRFLTMHEKQPGPERKDNGGEPITVDVAAIDVLRDRERGVPRYCQFRRLLGMKVPKDFEALRPMLGNPEWADELKEVYGEVGKIDLLVGTLAEKAPPGFALSDTAFQIFVLMAGRRLKSDRFFTDDFRAEIYTSPGMDWIRDNTMRSVIARHCPELAAKLAGLPNAFVPWPASTRRPANGKD